MLLDPLLNIAPIGRNKLVQGSKSIKQPPRKLSDITSRGTGFQNNRKQRLVWDCRRICRAFHQITRQQFRRQVLKVVRHQSILQNIGNNACNLVLLELRMKYDFISLCLKIRKKHLGTFDLDHLIRWNLILSVIILCLDNQI